METNVSLLGAVCLAVAKGLSERFGAPVSVTDITPLWPSQVFRCPLQSSADAVPETVIVRLPREGTGARSGSSPLDNERAALEYLTEVGSTLAPRFFAGGADAGFVASEDLGAGLSLLDLLLGDDPETATQGALAFAHALGRLHAQTVGLTGAARHLTHAPPAVSEHWQQVKEAIALLGLPAPGDAVDQDVAEVARILAEPGDFLALSNGDPSVVNCKVVNSSSVRFFDFEGACFRHALIDAIVLRFFYPTGGPAWRLPPELTLGMETAYRTELASVCPNAREEADFEKGMAAGAAWMILRLVRLPRVDAGPDRDPWLLLPPAWDGPVPMRSRRRQLVSILETWLASLSRFSALAAWCERLTDALRARWPEAAEELPPYPAFTRKS